METLTHDALETRTATVSSPSTVTVTVTAGNTSTLPTPDASGDYSNVPFDVAEQLVEFPLVVPDPMPAGVELRGVDLSASPLALPGTPQPAPEIATLFLDVTADDDPRTGFQFVQTPNGTAEPGIMPNSESTRRYLGGKEVIRTAGTNQSGDQLVEYVWERQGVVLRIIAILKLDGVVTDDLLQEFIAAVPA